MPSKSSATKAARRSLGRLVGARCEANAHTESGVCGKPARYNVLEQGIIIAACGGCAERARENGYCVVKRPNDKALPQGGAEGQR